MNPACKSFQDQFIDVFYNDADADQANAFQAHLKECPDCTAAYEKFTATLDIMNERKSPEPDAAFWDNYWDNLAPQLSESDISADDHPADSPSGPMKKLTFSIEHQWTYRFAAAAAILIIGILMGKFIFTGSGLERSSVPFTEAPGQYIQRAAVDPQTQQYLDRSKVLILGLVHLDPELMDSNFDFSRYQSVSRELVEEAAVIKEKLDQSKQNRLRALVADLEFILVQIANLEMENDVSAIEMLKSGVDRRGVLMKINLEEIRQQATTPTEEVEETI